MNAFRVHDLRASAVLLLAGLLSLAGMSAQAQLAGVVATGTRYAGNSTGSSGFSSDTGSASSATLNSPSYAVLDASGNLFVSDTQNNCVRKIDPAGNLTTVAGLRVNGGPDTCNASLNATPTPVQGLLAPTGLALDSAGTLYISDGQHNCVRSLAPGAIDSFSGNALTTVAGTCTALDTASVTPSPNGVAIDAGGTLYISIRDTAIPVNQVLRHRAGDPATTVCYLAGQASANVPNACGGVTNSVTLASPAGLALDPTGNLFIADTGNNCVREIAGLTTIQTVAGQCTSDGSGTNPAALQSPSGLAVTPGGALLISQSASGQNSIVSLSPGTGKLLQLAGLPSGASGQYSSTLDGQSALSTPLDAPFGLTTDPTGNIFVADSLNNVVRRFSTNQTFPAAPINATGASQTITFVIDQTVNLSTVVGADYTIAASTCTGLLTAAPASLPPNTCQVTVTFNPSRPGARTSALQLKDAKSGGIVSIALNGTGTGPLSLFTPGTVNTLVRGLRTPIAVTVDSAGNTYVLEQGNALTNSDVLLIPAGGGASYTVIAQGAGIRTPTAMAVDGAGNIFISDAATNTISRFGADGSVDLTYIAGLTNVSALIVDSFDNLYIAQAGSVHNVIEVYAGGTTRIIAGSGSTANADNVAATSALFVKPSGLALGPNGLAIADASGQRVYTVDSAGTIHMVAGNGTSSSTDITQATGTALLYPVGLAYDAAGDLYIVDEAADRVYEVYPVQSSGSNISTPLGSGATGYTGDAGPAPLATLQAPITIALDGSSNLYVIDFGNSAVREVAYSTVRNINFGDVILGTSPVVTQTIANAGNASLAITTPITTTDTHYSTSGSATTCTGPLSQGAVCNVGYTFTPTALGTVTAQSIVTTNAYDSPQTVNLTAYGLTTQNLPYTLAPETEVYGQPFVQTTNLSVVYPDLPPNGTISFTIGGGANGIGETTCSTSSPFAATINCNAPESGLGVGTYTVNFVFNSSDHSYFSTVGTVPLIITPGSLSVTPGSVTKPYGAPIPYLPGTIVGAVNGDVFLLSDSTTATIASPIGTYPIAGTLTSVGLASLSNYNVTYNTGTLTIAATPLTVTVINASRPYGSANPAFTSTIAGAANGDTFTVTYSTPASTTSAAGKYPITATITGPALANYAVTVVAGTLTVTPIPLTVTVANAARPYGAANPAFSASISGAINGDTFTQNLTTTAAPNSTVGAYPINDAIGGPAAGNYTITVLPGTLTITPAVVVLGVSASSASRLYGAPNPVFTSTITGALYGDTFAITYATPANATSPIGTYPVTPIVSGPAAANYTVAPVNGTLTVTQAPLTVAANNTTRQYNTANPIFTGATAGLLNGDVLSISYSTPATLTSPVGSYAIVPSVSGAALSNYQLTANNGTLTIIASAVSPLTVTVNSATRLYGSTNPTFTGTVTGLLNGDLVTVTYNSPASTTSVPGTYPITATVVGAAAANYTLNIVVGTLTVTPAPLVVTANDATRPYANGLASGSSAGNAGLTGTTVGLLNGDTVAVTYSTTATALSPVGTYPIIPAVSGAAAANYAVRTVNGTLTIMASATAPLVVTVNNTTRPYGTANPVLTGTVSGLVNGDTVTVTYSTTAGSSSAAGSYPITATVSGAAAANYVINVVPGALAVTAAATSTTLATSASSIFSATSVTFTATVTSSAGVPGGSVTFSNGSTVLGTATLDSSGAATFVTSALLPGNLTITASYTGSANYASSAASITQVVSAGSFTLVATPGSQFVRGAGSTTYTVTATSAQGFAGPVTLSCAGLAADAACTFASPTLTLTAGGTNSTTFTVSNTAADARLITPPAPSAPASRFAPIVLAATLPFELTGLGVLFGVRRRRKAMLGSPRLRLLLLLLCSAGIMGLAGCACFTSVYQNYTINITGTTTVPGVPSQTTSVILSVGQQ